MEPSATESAETDGATLVTGVAGSGKSIVLLFRACAQARLEPACFSLFLTHNKALNGELKSRFREIGDPPNVHWHTFSSWCYQQLSTLGRVPKLIAYSERDRLIDETARAIWPAISSQWTRFLRDEYDWIQDHGLRTLDSYLVADRLGRGLALQTDRRTQVFAAYRRYRAELQRRTREDWSGLALRLWLEVEKKTLRLPLYDYIYVDEAQFFAPVWFHTLRAALAPSGKIFLAADPTQGFLKRRQSWTASGFDMRGRSTRLRRAYRNTRAILEFAAAFYRSRLKDEEIGDLNLPEKDELDSAPVGEKVRFLPVASRQDEVLRVANEIRAFLNGGGEAGAVLVLTALGKSTATVAAHLGRAIGADNVCDARYAAIGGKVRVCALDGATGLEAAIVFIVGLAELLESENDLQLPADQRMETVRDNTRRLYMAFTRAGLHLSITWPGVLPQWAEFAGENPDQESLGHRRTCASR